MAKDEPKAREFLIAAADLKNIDAMFHLVALSTSAVERVGWYQRAADMGSIEAEYALGLCYLKGNGTVKDIKKGQHMVIMSAEHGNPLAMGLAARWIFSKSIDGHSDDEMIRWATTAAKDGIADGAYTVAMCYGQGRGVPQDDKKCQMYLLKAFDADSGESAFELAKRAENGRKERAETDHLLLQNGPTKTVSKKPPSNSSD